MSRRSKYSAEEKLHILMENINESKTISDICHVYEINDSTFYIWKYKYERYGIEGLVESNTAKRYPETLKQEAILDYLYGHDSYFELAKKYEISDSGLLKKWVKRYNSHRELEDNGKGMSLSMTKGRRTTIEERLEIVQICISNGCDYETVANQYKVSYQQVYQWTKKYESKGIEGLKDKRGRKKETKELAEQDNIKLKMKKLEADNEKLKAENAFLKKLQELGRRRY